MKESKSITYLIRTKDIMVDIFNKLKNDDLDAITDDELVKLFTFGTAIQVMAEEEYEDRHVNDEDQYAGHDIYELSWKNIDQVLS